MKRGWIIIPLTLEIHEQRRSLGHASSGLPMFILHDLIVSWTPVFSTDLFAVMSTDPTDTTDLVIGSF